MSMTIGKLAQAGGVGVETVRYYQRRGLLDQPERDSARGGVRRYDDATLRRLRFIRHAQAAGFTLDQISELVALNADADRARVRELAREQIAALDARIAALQHARDSLAKLAQRCGAGGAGPCPILTAFDA